MRLGRVLLLMMALQAAGCGLVHHAAGTLSSRLDQSLEDCREQARNRQLAEEVWKGHAGHYPGAFSEEFESGFKEGFASYLYRGGDGEPPPLAPQRYRGVKYQTHEGYQRVQDWFVGYRHGAWRARQTGYRELVTGPSALRSLPVPAPVFPPVSHEPVAQPRPTPEPVVLPPEVNTATEAASTDVESPRNDGRESPATPPSPPVKVLVPPAIEIASAEAVPAPVHPVPPAANPAAAQGDATQCWEVTVSLPPWCRVPGSDRPFQLFNIAFSTRGQQAGGKP